MPKIFYYTIILATILIGLNFALVDTGVATFSSNLLNAIGVYDTSNNYTSTILYTKYLMEIFAFAVLGIVVGYFTKQSTESYIVGGLCGALFGWAYADFTSIMVAVSTQCATDCVYMIWITKLIFWPLLAGYCIAIVQWWRGNDI